MLAVEHVSKSYGKQRRQALDDFTIELSPGIYGLLGPNGAGKSTLLNILTDNLAPDAGTVTYDGRDIVRMGKTYRNLLGYMPQQQGLYDEFSGRRFLWYMAVLKGLSRKRAKEKIEQLLNTVNLEQHAHKKLGSYSGGMKQRILIAQALLNDPRILILDEPTAGLDPMERIRLRNFVSTIAGDKIVIIATHVVSDIEFIANHIMLIKEGKLVCCSDPHSIMDSISQNVFEVQIDESELKKMQDNYKISNITRERGGLTVRILSDAPPKGHDVRLVKPTLEDVYLYTFD